MAKTRRVLNVTRCIRLKLKQAEAAVEVCSATWVEYGVSIRDLTLAEAIVMRNQQATRRERLAYAELPWLTYVPSVSAAEGHRQERVLARQADVFAHRKQISTPDALMPGA